MLSKKRNFGLDVIRASAIIMVIMAHIAPFFSSQPLIYNLFYHAGLYGVELFFVLSGYLIGQIVLKKMVNSLSVKTIKTFYMRRWLRTLPLFYFVLIILVFVANITQPDKNLHLLHFVFLQNFHPIESGFFGVSWSLSIEEWFYLLLPVLFLISKKKSINNITFYIGLSIVLILITRSVYVFAFQPTFDLGVRKFIPLRFDSLLIGVLLAQIKLNYKYLFDLFKTRSLFIFSLLLLGIYYLWYVNIMMSKGIIYFDQSELVRITSWPLISILMGLIMIFIENSELINSKFGRIKPVYMIFTYLSIYSYSMYLIHFEIYDYFHSNINILNSRFLNILTPTILIIFLSAMIYRYIEKPIMKKRDTIFPSKKI